MEIKQLEIFVSVAKNLSFSKAAEELYLSQSSVSIGVGALEKSLGVQLLARNSKGVSLTKAGLDLLSYAKEILSLRAHAFHNASGKDCVAEGAIDIISSTIPSQHLLPEIISSFKKQWRNVLFRITQADSHGVTQALRGFQYDFGMVGTIPDGERFVHYPIYDDELVLVAPGCAAESSEMTQNDFATYITRMPLIMREQGSGTRTEMEALFSKLGVEPRALSITAYLPDTHGILLAVSRGLGVSLVSKVAATMYERADMLKIIEVNSPLFRRQIHLLHNKELRLSPLQQAFADYARSFYCGNGTTE